MYQCKDVNNNIINRLVVMNCILSVQSIQGYHENTLVSWRKYNFPSYTFSPQQENYLSIFRTSWSGFISVRFPVLPASFKALFRAHTCNFSPSFLSPFSHPFESSNAAFRTRLLNTLTLLSRIT